MIPSRARTARAALLLAALALSDITRGSAHAAPELGVAEAQEVMVDLGRLWTRATGNTPLASRYFEAYLKAIEGEASGTPVMPEPRGPAFKAGNLLVRSAARAGTPSGSQQLVALPLVPVAPGDAAELYRRQSFLSLYLRKHAAVVNLIAGGRAPATVQMPEEQLMRYARQAAAAHVELFLIERIAFGEGETQEQKCEARRRADAHARALGFSGESPERPHLAPEWEGLYAVASQHYRTQHAPFREELCTEATVVTRGEARGALEQLLTVRLERNIADYFQDRIAELENVQRAFTERVNMSYVGVPRDEIVQMRRRLTDAQDLYGMVSGDALALSTYIDELQRAAAKLIDQLEGDPEKRGVLAEQQRTLEAVQGELASFLALARSLASIRFSVASDAAALQPCASVPESLAASGGADIPTLVGGCLTAALELRARLSASPHVSPERVRFLEQLQSLSHAYLTANTWARP